MREITKINGHPLVSDKTCGFRQLKDGTVLFDDGTRVSPEGGIDFKGTGTIQFRGNHFQVGKFEVVDEEEDGSSKIHRCAATEKLVFDSLASNIVVETWDLPFFEVEVDGDPNEYSEISLDESFDNVVVSSSERDASFSLPDISEYSNWFLWSIASAGWIIVAVLKSFIDVIDLSDSGFSTVDPDITVRVPATTSLTFESCTGNITLPEILGDTTADLSEEATLTAVSLCNLSLTTEGPIVSVVQKVTGVLNTTLDRESTLTIRSAQLTSLVAELGDDSELHIESGEIESVQVTASDNSKFLSQAEVLDETKLEAGDDSEVKCGLGLSSSVELGSGTEGRFSGNCGKANFSLGEGAKAFWDGEVLEEVEVECADGCELGFSGRVDSIVGTVGDGCVVKSDLSFVSSRLSTGSECEVLVG